MKILNEVEEVERLEGVALTCHPPLPSTSFTRERLIKTIRAPNDDGLNFKDKGSHFPLDN